MPEQDETLKGSDVQQKSEAPVEDNRPTYQKDLEARLELDHKAPKPDSKNSVVDPAQTYAPYATETTDTSQYVGVSPEYMTHASDTEKPLPFGGVEAKSVEQTLGAKGNFAVSPEPEYAGKQVVGGGSTVESVYTGTSGEVATAEKVDRQEGQKELERPELQTALPTERPQATDAETSKATVTTPAKPPVRPAARQ